MEILIFSFFLCAALVILIWLVIFNRPSAQPKPKSSPTSWEVIEMRLDEAEAQSKRIEAMLDELERR